MWYAQTGKPFGPVADDFVPAFITQPIVMKHAVMGRQDSRILQKVLMNALRD